MPAELIPMTVAHASQVAAIHLQSIHHGVLCALGPQFMARLYEGIAAHPQSSVWVAVRSGRVLGFCAYTRNVSAMYRDVILSNFWTLARFALPQGLRWRVIRQALDVLCYPFRRTVKSMPQAEVLSIALDPAAQGGGVGSRLLQAAMEQARLDGEPLLRVMVGSDLETARHFYERLGFEHVGDLTQHGDTLCVYTRRVEVERQESGAKAAPAA